MKCFKCQNDTFDKSLLVVKTLDETSKYEPERYKLEVLTCKKCHLIQLYDNDIVAKKKVKKRAYKESSYQLPKPKVFTCWNCKSNNSYLNRISPSEKSMSFRLFVSDWRTELEWTGEILLRTCSKCGLIEPYEIILTKPMVSNINVKQRINLAEHFNCPMCNGKKVSQTGIISFYEKLVNVPKYREDHQVWYLFCTCEKCKYITVINEQ